MQVFLKRFRELTLDELYALLKLRAEVFVVEQNCPYQDLDGYDQSALHLYIIHGDKPSAYARIIPPGAYYKEASIGRVITSKEYRMTGLGKKLFEQCIKICKQHYSKQAIRIMAQCYLRKFYMDFGFVEEGPEFIEDGIPHVEMTLTT